MAEKLMLEQFYPRPNGRGPLSSNSFGEPNVTALASLEKFVCVFALVIRAGRGASRSGHSWIGPFVI